MLHTMFMTCETYSHSILTLTRPLSMSVWGLLVAGGGEAGTESWYISTRPHSSFLHASSIPWCRRLRDQDTTIEDFDRADAILIVKDHIRVHVSFRSLCWLCEVLGVLIHDVSYFCCLGPLWNRSGIIENQSTNHMPKLCIPFLKPGDITNCYTLFPFGKKRGIQNC
jgi:hypothetical protein